LVAVTINLLRRTKELDLAFESFHSCIIYNRVYLPDEIVQKVMDISERARKLCFIIRINSYPENVGMEFYIPYIMATREFDSLSKGNTDLQLESIGKNNTHKVVKSSRPNYLYIAIIADTGMRKVTTPPRKNVNICETR
jgi:hypothetical protein